MRTDKREEMEISPLVDSHFQFTGGFFDFAGDQRSSLGFVELLGLPEFQNSVFDLPPPSPMLGSVSLPPETANLPATPNSSSISSDDDEAANSLKRAVTVPDGDDDEDGFEKEKKPSKAVKRKGQKRPREQRVAFMTKSEVDHLEDGYRWRKYGQKAVKNSPFPRSYYRCTAATCGVKKRVERSWRDPAVVVTTYEGQHTHPSPVVTRGGPLGRPAQQIPGMFAPPPVQFGGISLPFLTSYLPPSQPLDFRHVDALDCRYCNPSADISTRDHGLLQDLIPSVITKKED
nr:WRKY transcription factor 30 [Crocus sativus]